jgi:hypothetical protein
MRSVDVDLKLDDPQLPGLSRAAAMGLPVRVNAPKLAGDKGEWLVEQIIGYHAQDWVTVKLYRYAPAIWATSE